MTKTLELRAGDRVLWPERDRGDGLVSRHDSGTVVRVEYDKAKDGVVAKVVCTREWFYSGIDAEHEVER